MLEKMLRQSPDFREIIDPKHFKLRSLENLKSKVDMAGLAPAMHDFVKNRRTHGTTVLALKYQDGIVIAGDRRGTAGHVHVDEFVKVQDMGNLTFIACSGTSAYIAELEKTLKTVRMYWEDIVGEPIYIDGQAELLQKILREHFEYLNVLIYMLGYYAVPILAGFDPFLKKGRLFEFEENGGMYERPNYVTSGSGGIFAETILDDRWETDMSESKAVLLAIRAIMRSAKDNYTSPGTLAPITVYSVSDKVHFLPAKKSLQLARELDDEDKKRRGGRKE